MSSITHNKSAFYLYIYAMERNVSCRYLLMEYAHRKILFILIHVAHRQQKRTVEHIFECQITILQTMLQNPLLKIFSCR